MILLWFCYRYIVESHFCYFFYLKKLTQWKHNLIVYLYQNHNEIVLHCGSFIGFKKHMVEMRFSCAYEERSQWNCILLCDCSKSLFSRLLIARHHPCPPAKPWSTTHSTKFTFDPLIAPCHSCPLAKLSHTPHPTRFMCDPITVSHLTCPPSKIVTRIPPRPNLHTTPHRATTQPINTTPSPPQIWT